jgi:hypothetical protein
MPEVRFAIYYAPEPSSLLWQLGCGVIGYDAARAMEVPFLVPDGFAEADWRQWTSDPRRYGFHATLKAPFRLAPGETRDRLVAAMASLAQRLHPVALGRLVPSEIGPYIALQPSNSPAPQQALAQLVVEALEAYRAPLTGTERGRRRPETLTPRQRMLLDTFGYPYVAEEFRFHMTLAGPLPAERQAKAVAELRALCARTLADVDQHIDRFCLFEQADPAGPFRITAALSFG